MGKAGEGGREDEGVGEVVWGRGNVPPSSCSRFLIAWFGFGILFFYCGGISISMMDFWLFMVFGGEGVVSGGGGGGGSCGGCGQCGPYISLSMNSNLPSTAMTASLRSCFRRTGPMSL